MIKVYQTIECKNNVITTISFKGVKVKVEFKGGNVMKGIPARLYTNDPFVQKALDESDQKGRMYRFVQALPEGNDGAPEAGATQQRTQKRAPEKPADDAAGTAAAVEEPTPGFPTDDAAGSDGIDDGGDNNGAGGQKLEFDNLAEAITYIASMWGEQVENENQARKFIEEKTGVKPVIHKG